MKKQLFLFIILCAAISPALGQKRRLPVKSAPAVKKTAAPVAEISDKDWTVLTSALSREDWTPAVILSAAALKNLKTENEKKQLAQLRYFYIYALAGKVSTGRATYSELQKSADGFIGQEFLMPSRTMLADCRGKVNYICPVKDNDRAVRVTATDKTATIHSFEYVKLSEKFADAGNDGNAAFLGGTLEKTETFLTKSNLPIIRLVFENGFVKIVAKR